MRLSWLMPAACFVLAGCGGPPLPPETDPAAGRAALTKVLDAWKAGGTPDAVMPIITKDPDWAAGAKLTGYQIAADDGRSGVDLLVSVKLQLTRADGKAQEKTVNYVVAVAAATVVLRKE